MTKIRFSRHSPRAPCLRAKVMLFYWVKVDITGFLSFGGMTPLYRIKWE